MNKGERQRIKKLKFIRRLKVYGFLNKLDQPSVNLNAFRSTGKPCSCFLCSPLKFKRKVKHKKYLNSSTETEIEELFLNLENEFDKSEWIWTDDSNGPKEIKENDYPNKDKPLTKLLNNVTKRNIHKEINSDSPKGNEEW